MSLARAAGSMLAPQLGNRCALGSLRRLLGDAGRRALPVAGVHEFGPHCQAVRGVARVRINRFTGMKATKMSAPKTEWQIAAEKAFLALRDKTPKEGYTWYLTEDDVRNLSPQMQNLLSLKHGSEEDISKWRKQELVRKFQRRPFDTNSPAVKIAMLTEKILRLRTHLLRKNSIDQDAKRVMSMFLSRRMKHMKNLYKFDYVLYKHVCSELGIRFVRFAIPDSRDPQKSIAPMAVDGDRAKFLIRQRMYHGRFRPRRMRVPETDRVIRYTRHPMEPVPETHGKAKAVPQQISRAWPYGVSTERTEGKQVVYNPTAAGKGFWPARGAVPGGRTPQ